RNSIRQARIRSDHKALEALASSSDISRLPPETVVQLATALLEPGRSEQALALLRQAHLHYPEDWWINNLLGSWCWRGGPGHEDEAIRYYTACMALRPHNIYTLYEISALQRSKKNYVEAVATVTRVIELKPDSARAWLGRGMTYTEMRQWDKAV